LYFLIIQQLESNVLGPRITGHAVGLHPLGALMALLVGIELDGILGALFAVPVTGMLYVFSMAIYYHFTGRQQPEPLTRRATTPALWDSLSNAEIVRTLRARLPEGLQPDYVARRDEQATKPVFPRRLAQVEELRDALVRDKMQQRHMATEPMVTMDDVVALDVYHADRTADNLDPMLPDSKDTHRDQEDLADERSGKKPVVIG
jgi:hypothetical protein